MQLFLAAFQGVPDPRAENVRHDLVEILIIAFIAVLCGAQGCSEMAEFGRGKLKFFKRFLKLRHGVPSHDTFSTVLRMLDPESLDAAFGQITARLVAALAKGGVIAIDGKSLKGAYDKGEKSSPKMMVSAYAAGLRLTLATVAANNGNEVDAALEVIGLIDLKGKIVTGDALHCNRRMVGAIVDKGGDYCITLKANQESLLSDPTNYPTYLPCREAVASDAARYRPRALADRERSALAARRLIRRGRSPQPQGQRPGQHRGASPPRPRRGSPRSKQGIADGKAQTSGLERGVHAEAAESNAIALPRTRVALRRRPLSARRAAMGGAHSR